MTNFDHVASTKLRALLDGSKDDEELFIDDVVWALSFTQDRLMDDYDRKDIPTDVWVARQRCIDAALVAVRNELRKCWSI